MRPIVYTPKPKDPTDEDNTDNSNTGSGDDAKSKEALAKDRAARALRRRNDDGKDAASDVIIIEDPEVRTRRLAAQAKRYDDEKRRREDQDRRNTIEGTHFSYQLLRHGLRASSVLTWTQSPGKSQLLVFLDPFCSYFFICVGQQMMYFIDVMYVKNK
jgi:hypothetical protein